MNRLRSRFIGQAFLPRRADLRQKHLTARAIHEEFPPQV
jgi:hypothetical protein